jgi:hypothetical protein
MKKNVFILSIILCISTLTTQAQFKFGIKAGVNLSKITYNGGEESTVLNENISNITGFQAGPMIELMIPVLNMGLDAAALYSQEGGKINLKEYRTNTLEIPVNLKYKISVLNIIGFYTAVGPYASFRLSDNLKDQYKEKSFGAGLNFGFGVELIKHLQIGANYKLGLTDNYSKLMILQNEPRLLSASADHSDNFTGKTRGWTIAATYFF